MDQKIHQFMSVTGSSEDIARTYLEACAGDITMAIGMHLENGAASSVAVDPGSVQNPEDLVVPKNYEKMLVLSRNKKIDLLFTPVMVFVPLFLKLLVS